MSAAYGLILNSLCSAETILPGAAQSLITSVSMGYASELGTLSAYPPFDTWNALLRTPRIQKFEGRSLDMVAFRRKIGQKTCNHIIPVCPQLQQFTIEDSDIDMTNVDMILRACPRLKGLLIKWSEREPGEDALFDMSIKRFGDLLRRHAPPMEWLDLEPNRLPCFACPEEFPIGNLAALTNLTRIGLTEWSVFGMPGPCASTDVLSTILPNLIETIYIFEDLVAPFEQSVAYMRRCEKECEDLVAAGSRPNLRLVVLLRRSRIPKAIMNLPTLTAEQWRKQPRGFWYKRPGPATDLEKNWLRAHRKVKRTTYDDLKQALPQR